MYSSNQVRDKPRSSFAKALHADDAGHPSPALQGAALAFSSSPAPSDSTQSRHSGNNGALAAASFAGLGWRSSARQLSFGAVPVHSLRTPEGEPAQRHARQRVSASYGALSSTDLISSREQSPSHIAAVTAAINSSPAQESIGPPRSNSRRPSPLQRAQSDFQTSVRSTDKTPIVAANALVRLYEKKEILSNRSSLQEAHHDRNTIPSVISPTPIRPPSGRISRQSILPLNSPKPTTRNRGSTATFPTNFSSLGARTAAGNAAKSVQPVVVRSQSSMSSKGPAQKPPSRRENMKRPALPPSRNSEPSSISGELITSSSASSYASTVDKTPSPHKEPPSTPLPRNASEPLSKSNAQASLSYETVFQRPAWEVKHRLEKPSISREATLSTTSLVPQLTANSLANAMVASSLASSRAPSPTRPHLPPPRRHGKPHHLFYRSHSFDHISRTPSPAKQMKQTLRPSKKVEDEEVPYRKRRSHFMKKHPNKHHEGDRKRWRDTVSEAERKRYEGLWAANKNILLPPSDPPSNTVCNIIVRDIWRRSRLPDDVLEEVWELVDMRREGSLGKEEFVVGMWLIDQRLKGRKLPFRVSESVWGSVRMLSGIKVPKHRR